MPLTCIQCKNETSSTTNDMCESCYQASSDFKQRREAYRFESRTYPRSKEQRRRDEEESAANEAATIAMLATVITAGGM